MRGTPRAMAVSWHHFETVSTLPPQVMKKTKVCKKPFLCSENCKSKEHSQFGLIVNEGVFIQNQNRW